MAKIHARDCPNCGKNFKPPKNDQKYCTEVCGHEFRAKTHRAEISQLLAEGKIPSTRHQSLLSGSQFYFTGRTCRNGHRDVYLAHNKCCFSCQQISRRKRHSQKSRPRNEHKPVKIQSVQTASTWLHILPNWQPIIVERV